MDFETIAIERIHDAMLENIRNKIATSIKPFHNQLSMTPHEKIIKNLDNIVKALDQSIVIAITDQAGIITYVNNKFCELSKYSAEELIGKTHQTINSGFHPTHFYQEFWQSIRSGKIWEGDIKNRAKDGSEYWVKTTIVPFLNTKEEPYQYISIQTDITGRKEAEHSLKDAIKNDFRQTVKHLQNAVFKYVDDGNDGFHYTLVEGKIAEQFGLTSADSIEENVKRILSPEEVGRIKRRMKLGLQGKATQFELNWNHNTFLIYLSPIFEKDKVIEVVGTTIDITDRKEAEKLIEHMAYYDYLTGLPNRRLFQLKAQEVIMQAQKNDELFAVLFIDLDHFKNVNDSMGHLVGDKLLKIVGERLEKCVRQNDFVARLGGDEYAILLTSVHLAEVEKVAARIVDNISQSFNFENLEVFVTPSIGISMFPQDGYDYDTLVNNADSAMYVSKNNGKGTYSFFTEESHYDMQEQTTLEMDLRQALHNEQFELHYQPQVCLKTGQVTGLEALVRWNHPEKGMISPARFIPIAEETGLIISIGQWVLETACEQVQKWQNGGLPPIQISVNVSARQFRQSSFIRLVKETLVKTGLHPTHLNLEITESMTTDVNNCQLMLRQLRDIGINVSIDDFGTGYSSLSYLSDFPITHLKIDQVFVQNLSTSKRAIVKTIITLAKSLNLNVIAEGVETDDQMQFLKNLKCDSMQGFYYSKPLPTDQIEAFLKQEMIYEM